MGLRMGMALAYRSHWQRFATSDSPHLQHASEMMQEGWEAYREMNPELIMYRFRDTVQAMDREIEALRSQVTSLTSQLAEAQERPKPRPSSGRLWWQKAQS